MKQAIRLFKVRMVDDAVDNVAQVLRSGYVGEGPVVKEFEAALAKRFEFVSCLGGGMVSATNSATAAEQLAYRIMRVRGMIEPGDEVLATPLTCTATNWPILANSLKIKWVDVDPLTMNMDLDDLTRKITHKTKVISVVHWGGYPVDMERLEKIRMDAANKLGIYPTIIQDCAHAIDSSIHGETLTQWGDFATYSFQAIKHLTCGDGGALVCKHSEDDRQAKLLRWYGIDRDGAKEDFRCEADIPAWGLKWHMNDIAASIGLANLTQLDDTIAKHRANALFYDQQLAFAGGVQVLRRDIGFKSSCWIYTMRVENRKQFMEMMKEKGVEVSRVHDRNDKHSCVEESLSLLPNLDAVCKDMICIPTGWWITEEDRQHIVDCIKGGW